MPTDFKTSPGLGLPLGVSKGKKGPNFAFFTPQDKKATLHLFDLQRVPLATISCFKTGQVSHVEVEGLTVPFAYAWEIEGVKELLVDPWSKGILSNPEWGAKPYEPLSLYFEFDFDWEGVEPPQFPDKDLVVYEVHTRSFTKDPTSGVQHPGTLTGFIEKLPYLKDLGINAIELLPISEFNEGEYGLKVPQTGEQLYNFWGYSTVHFFAPSNRFLSSPPFGLNELAEFVKAAHKLGIKVILDIVYNHTAEGGSQGPTYHFKGIDKNIFYLMDGENYLNFSGCGNTLKANHPIVVEWIMKTLRDFVLEAHIDGFRFDLASCLKRGEGGAIMFPSPLLEAISNDPFLANTIMIAEPWDPGGLYESGHFYTSRPRWKEWNGQYRDTMRAYIKGTPGFKGSFSTRISGSQDLFGDNRTPLESLNFITCHDGFSMRDLVSYNGKHNERNGEDNRDGENNNTSWNCGAEGPTDDPSIIALRERQIKNHLLALFVSQGIPMLLSGDEYGHTKDGNNNTWCHDDRLNYFQWDTLEKNQGIYNFVKKLITYRQKHPHFKKGHFLTDKDIAWHGKRPFHPIWDIEVGPLGFTLKQEGDPKQILVIFNPHAKIELLNLPKLEGKAKWHLVANTNEAAPKDFLEEGERTKIDLPFFTLQPYSSVILESKETAPSEPKEVAPLEKKVVLPKS